MASVIAPMKVLPKKVYERVLADMLKDDNGVSHTVLVPCVRCVCGDIDVVTINSQLMKTGETLSPYFTLTPSQQLRFALELIDFLEQSGELSTQWRTTSFPAM
jgi:hypothetical protein